MSLAFCLVSCGLEGGAPGNPKNEISKFLGYWAGHPKTKTKNNEMEFKVQRVQQGPPFHPLESSRLVESGRPGYTI